MYLFLRRNTKRIEVVFSSAITPVAKEVDEEEFFLSRGNQAAPSFQCACGLICSRSFEERYAPQ